MKRSKEMWKELDGVKFHQCWPLISILLLFCSRSPHFQKAIKRKTGKKDKAEIQEPKYCSLITQNSSSSIQSYKKPPKGPPRSNPKIASKSLSVHRYRYNIHFLIYGSPSKSDKMYILNISCDLINYKI